MGNGQTEKLVTLGVIIGDVSYDYTMELMHGINDAAAQRGVQLFYLTGKQRHTAPDNTDNEQETVSRYNSIYDYSDLIGADVFIISSGSLSGLESDEEYRRFLNRFSRSPYVLLQKQSAAGNPSRCSITVDNYGTFSTCIEHLITTHGYTKIAYVSGPKRHPEAIERERAYRDTMAKHGLAVADGMLVYGDLSGFVDAQVEQLLATHPDLEAIAFCNDDMAKTGYKVCENYGLRVGIDIAITGFDDFTTGQTLTPPLTTVSQDAYRAGELAVIQALKLAAGEPAESINLKTDLQVRNSCGCYRRDTLPPCSAEVGSSRAYIQTVIDNTREKLSHIFTRPGQQHLTAVADTLMNHIQTLAFEDTPLDFRALDAWLIDLAADALTSAGGMIAECLHEVLMQMAGDAQRPCVQRFYQLFLHVQGFLYQYEIRTISKRVEGFRTQAWFVPEFIRDLVVIVDEDERVYLNVVNKLRSIGLSCVYICLLPEPQVHREIHQPFDSDKLLLAAYLCDDGTHAYPRAKMPSIDPKHTLRDLPDLQSDAHMISFSIFSGDMQFGICICRENRQNNPLMHIIGLQLGILMNFLDLKRKEQLVAREIEHVQKKNEELNYLSEYDTLCNVYNRRGFIEQAFRLNQVNVGKRAFLAFADLDHLKKINDNFGHAAGDSAIQTVSTILKKVIRGGDLIARISGDEFVGMFIADSDIFRQNFEKRIQQAIEEYNRTSDKPYFVGFSVGITDFMCEEELDIGRIIDRADQFLYEAKKHKRASIFK